MKVTVEELPRRELLLTFEAEPADLDEYRKKAYRHLVQRVRIPGFRQGKAPFAMVEAYVGKAAVTQEAIHHLIPDATDKAIKERSIQAAATPDIELGAMEPVAWKAKVALIPNVELGNYRELRIEQEPVAVREEEMSKVLEELRFQQAPWQPVERPAEMGDLVTIDVHGEEDGRRVAEDKGAQYRLEPGSAHPMPGFAEQLVGVKAGETKAFALTVPRGAGGAEPAQREVKFRVTASGVKAKTLPPLDDEFAKGVGEGFDTLQDLREHVAAELKAGAERAAKEALREKALDKLVETAKVDFSLAFIEREAEHLLGEQERRLAENKIGVNEYLKSVGKTREQVLDEIKPEAERRVIRSLVLTKLKEQEGIAVAPEEVAQSIQEMAASAGERAQRVQRALDNERTRSAIESSLATRKTLDRLVELVTRKPAAEAPASGIITKEAAAP